MEDNKSITVTTKDQSGMPKMIAEIFKSVIFSQRGLHIQMQNIRSQGWEIFETFRKEFLKSQRPRLFFGSKTSEEALLEANEYAMKMMQNFFEGFREEENNLVTQAIKILKESPDQFLRVIGSIMAEANGNNQLQEPGSADQYALEELLKRMKIG